MQLPHRDIFAGYVAGAIAENGGFGEEVSAYAFYCWDPERFLSKANSGDHIAARASDEALSHVQVLTFGSEFACVCALYQAFLNGELVSNYSSLVLRVSNGEQVDLPAGVAKLLEDERGDGFKRTVLSYIHQTSDEKLLNGKSVASCAREDMSVGDNEVMRSIIDFAGKLDDRYKAQVLNGLCALAVNTGCHDARFAHRGNQEAFFSPEANAFVGFAYREGEKIKFYSNAYAPTTFKKWLNTPSRSALLYEDPVATGAPFERRKSFEKVLKDIFDESYFGIIDALEAGRSRSL